MRISGTNEIKIQERKKKENNEMKRIKETHWRNERTRHLYMRSKLSFMLMVSNEAGGKFFFFFFVNKKPSFPFSCDSNKSRTLNGNVYSLMEMVLHRCYM